jgi:hypothetical protein
MSNIGVLLADQVEPPDLIAAWDCTSGPPTPATPEG